MGNEKSEEVRQVLVQVEKWGQSFQQARALNWFHFHTVRFQLHDLHQVESPVELGGKGQQTQKGQKQS